MDDCLVTVVQSDDALITHAVAGTRIRFFGTSRAAAGLCQKPGENGEREMHHLARSVYREPEFPQ